jgi:energy-coupling factor transporter ATP-binding protein EcfA2
MKIKATFLRPTWASATTTKSYRLDDQRKPELTNTYKLGKEFKFAQASFKDIEGFASLLKQCADSKIIRIAGTPTPLAKASTTGVVRRKKEYFADEGTQILIFDADSWEVGDGFSLSTPKAIKACVQDILIRRMGFDFLEGAQFAVLMSSSYWNNRVLRAHIYFLLDAPIKLEVLHEWGFTYNSFNPEYKLDYSLFRQVQPDFVSRRICQGFKDPLSESLRLSTHCDSLSPYVSLVGLMGHINKTVAQAQAYAPALTTGVVGSQVPLSSTWEKTLAMCGAKHGINEMAYRACAQLVQEIGNDAVTKNLQYYTDKVFVGVWDAIAKEGIRGDKKDRDYYDRTRFKGYITTALKKDFGQETDSKTRNIATTIKKVINGGSISLLFDKDVLEDCRHLQTNMPGKWAMVRAAVKKELKGKVTISDIEKAMSGGKVTKQDISRMIGDILSEYEWIEGKIDNGLYCKKKVGEGYSLIGLDEGLDNTIYAKALDMFDTMPINFERSVMKVISALSVDRVNTPFAPAIVENRCHTRMEHGKNVTYINLGTSIHGDMTTCVVDENGIEVKPSSLIPITWSTSKNILPSEVLNVEDFRPIYGDDTEKELINMYFDGMREFTSAEDGEAFVDLVAWHIVALVNTGTATLLELTGESGSGKSHTALFMKELIDPTSKSVRDAPDLHNGLYKKEDLAKVLRSRHITVIDNISNLTPNQQDLLCSIATGWTYDLRIYYTQMFLNLVIKKPLIMTSLIPVITNQDLRSRSISVSIDGRSKTMGGDIYELWERDKPLLLTGLLCLCSKVIKYVNDKRDSGGNLNDRDLWGTAARVVTLQLLGICKDNASAEKHVGIRKQVHNIMEALMNSRTSILVVWLLHSPDFIGVNTVEESTSELYDMFSIFVQNNAGSVFKVHGESIRVAPKYIPNTVRAFAGLLGRCTKDLSDCTGWKIEKTRGVGSNMSRSGRLTKFSRDVPLTT